jgi:hypothetical protein
MPKGILNKASLVMVPEAPIDGTMPSVFPEDRSGDFTFTRGSNLSATRVASNGLIEKGRENLLLQSNQFDTTWFNSNTTETSGQTGYDGTSDAWLLTKTASSGRIQQGTFNAGVYSFSVYLKSDTNNWVQLYLDTTTATDPNAFFDLQNGLVGTTSNNIDASIESIGNGWYRCSIVGVMTTTFVAMIFPAEADNDKSASSGSIYIQDAQLEVGLVATDYIESGATTGTAGLLENEPRIDFTGGGCGALLLEPQRTNELIHSEYASTWAQNTADITLSDNLSPEGYKNCWRVEGTASGTQVGVATFNRIQGATYTTSIWVRKVSGSDTAIFKDVNNSSTIIDITSEWKRYTLTTTITTTTARLYISVRDVGDVIEVYGAQLEQGSYPTSYIPTYGSAVTRNQDYCKNAAPQLGDSQGTLFLEYSALDNYADAYNYFALSDKSYNNRIAIINSIGSTNQVRAFAFVGGVRYFDFFVSVTDITSNTKVALTYKENYFAIYVNGVKSAADTSGSIFPDGTLNDVSFTEVGNNASPFTGRIKQALVFPTALTDEECSALTQP